MPGDPTQFTPGEQTRLRQAQLGHPSGAGLAEQIIGVDENLDLRQRSNLIELDRQLHTQWRLGRNFVLGWTPQGLQLLLLVVPHRRLCPGSRRARSQRRGIGE